MMLIRHMVVIGILGIALSYEGIGHAQTVPKLTSSSAFTPSTKTSPSSSTPVTPAPTTPKPSSSLTELKEKLRAPRQHPARPNTPLPPEPVGHPEPFITRGDAKEIFSVIENQLNAIQHNDFATAYYNYTAEPFKKTTALDEFTFFMSSYPVFTNNKNSIFSSLKLDDNIAHLEGTLTSVGGEVQKVKYFFIQENGLWKIIGIKLLPPDTQQTLSVTPSTPPTFSTTYNTPVPSNTYNTPTTPGPFDTLQKTSTQQPFRMDRSTSTSPTITPSAITSPLPTPTTSTTQLFPPPP